MMTCTINWTKISMPSSLNSAVDRATLSLMMVRKILHFTLNMYFNSSQNKELVCVLSNQYLTSCRSILFLIFNLQRV